jgi:hypothetical protein
MTRFLLTAAAVLLWLPAAAQIPFNSDITIKGLATATGAVQGSELRTAASGGTWITRAQSLTQVSLLPAADASGTYALEVLTGWSATRTGQALIRAYGPGTDWNRNGGITHDGAAGYLLTGYGPLIFDTESVERMRIRTTGNVSIGTPFDEGFRLDIVGGPVRIRTASSPYLNIETTSTTATDAAYLRFMNGNSKNYSLGTYADGRFFLYDAAAARDLLSYVQGGRLSLQPTAGDTLLSASLRVYNGGNDGLSTGYSSIRTNLGSGNMVINAKSGAVYFNYDHGTGGVYWGNGAWGTVAYMDSTGNMSVNGQISVTGASGAGVYVGSGSSQYLVNTTLSGGTSNGDYGLYFDKTNEALQLWTGSASRISITGAGAVSIGGTLSVTGTITGTLSGNATNVTGTVAIANGGTGRTTAASAYAAFVNSQPHQINFVYGGSASTAIDNTTVNNVWRAHAYAATISEVACWTDAGTVTLAVKDSAGNMVTSSPLACSSTGASTTAMNTSYNAITSGEGLGFTTSSVSGVKNLSVSIKYTRAY